MKFRLTISGVISALALAAGPAAAGQCGYQYCWGAVGFGPGGAGHLRIAYTIDEKPLGEALGRLADFLQRRGA